MSAKINQENINIATKVLEFLFPSGAYREADDELAATEKAIEAVQAVIKVTRLLSCDMMVDYRDFARHLGLPARKNDLQTRGLIEELLRPAGVVLTARMDINGGFGLPGFLFDEEPAEADVVEMPRS